MSSRGQEQGIRPYYEEMLEARNKVQIMLLRQGLTPSAEEDGEGMALKI